MKQAIIALKKKLLIVELSGGAVNIRTTLNGNILYDISQEPQVPKWVYTEIKAKSFCGKLTDITEEQFHKWSGSYEWEDAPEGSKYAYKDYKDGKETDEYWDMYPFDTAKESFFSKLEAEGIYFENPLGEELMKWNKYESIHKKIPHTPYSLYKKDWQEAQEKLWNRDNTYIFEIL